jgi:hypothetical protein
MKIRHLFHSLAELTDYCTANPGFPASLGYESPLELWTFNVLLPSPDNP